MKSKICKLLSVAVGVFMIASFSPLQAKEGQVPLELVNKATVSFSNQFFGKGAFGPTQIYYGLDDKQAVYVFTLALGRASFPSENEI